MFDLKFSMHDKLTQLEDNGNYMDLDHIIPKYGFNHQRIKISEDTLALRAEDSKWLQPKLTGIVFDIFRTSGKLS